MARNSPLLNDTSHRPWPLPGGRWEYYQEWNEALFLHWEVPFDSLRKLVPEGLQPDDFEGRYYVSVVAFTMRRIRPRLLFSVPLVSNFHEVNVRTYVVTGGKPGVYFLNIEAQKWLSTIVARSLSGLPYEKADIERGREFYVSHNRGRQFELEAEFSANSPIETKNQLDRWLTERYCLYLTRGSLISRYQIHHREWPLARVELKRLKVTYRVGDITLTEKTTPLSHYSTGVEVVSWKKETVLDHS